LTDALRIYGLRMPKREIMHPRKTISTGAYSSGVLVDGWLYVAGHASIDLTTGAVIGSTIEDQVRTTLGHIRVVVEAAGGRIDDIVRCTTHLADLGEFERYNQTYREFFAGVLPARTTVQSYLGAGIKVEIDAVARIGCSAG
jgi:2-iminobutanoate/2-iminopropanoate deaminase